MVAVVHYLGSSGDAGDDEAVVFFFGYGEVCPRGAKGSSGAMIRGEKAPDGILEKAFGDLFNV